jgi:hypothetical protein
MAANYSQVLSGGKADGLIKRITTARTSVATIASPADASDLRLLFTAGTNGGFVDMLSYQFVGTGTQAATIVYFWLTDETGANAELWPDYSQLVAGGSAMSNTVMGQRIQVPVSFGNLKAGQAVYSSVSVLSANCECIVDARGGQFEAQ